MTAKKDLEEFGLTEPDDINYSSDGPTHPLAESAARQLRKILTFGAPVVTIRGKKVRQFDLNYSSMADLVAALEAGGYSADVAKKLARARPIIPAMMNPITLHTYKAKKPRKPRKKPRK